MTFLERIGGRKFVLAIFGLLIGAVISVVTGKLSVELVSLIVGVIGVFNGANAIVSSKALSAEQREPSQAVEPVNLEGIEQRLATLEVTMGQVAVATSNTNKLLAAAMKQGV